MVVQSRGTLCRFPLLKRYLLREESMPQRHLYDQMGLLGPAWLLHGPSSAEQTEAPAAPGGVAWLSGWTLGEPLSSWVQAVPEASRKYGKEWERNGKVAAAVLRTSGCHGAFCPAVPVLGMEYSKIGLLGRGSQELPQVSKKHLGHLPRPRSLKGG